MYIVLVKNHVSIMLIKKKKKKKVCCGGYFGCQQSVINNTQNIYITGDLSGNNAVINSKDIDTMNIYLLSRTSYDSNGMMIINCNKGDECILFCSSNKGCEYVRIHGYNNLPNDSVFR